MLENLGEPLNEEETQQVLDEIADLVVKRKLETMAIMFLEMNKPLSFIAGQGMIVAMPFLGPFIGADKMARYSRFLQTHENVELLIQRIEDKAEERDLAERKDKQSS